MPLVASSGLPTFERLRDAGQEVLSAERARHQDIRELHIGLLNIMPDAALQATERQFLRLIGSCNRIAQFYVHPFDIRGVPRAGAAKAHVEAYYESFEQVRADGLDALIITGANPASPRLEDEPFWAPLAEVMDWARESVCSTVYSCLATHAALARYHDTHRVKLPHKRWGVYEHRVTDDRHPLVANVNTRFDGPHSHVYDMPPEAFETAGTHVLVCGEEAGVYLAVSADRFRNVYFQGHPEYDRNSLFKEFKREIGRFLGGQRDDYPRFPEHYFSSDAEAVLEDYRRRLQRAMAAPGAAPEHLPLLPEAEIEPLLDNTWTDTGKALFNNWLGLVYQLTHHERRKPFMDGVDPNDPLRLLGA